MSLWIRLCNHTSIYYIHTYIHACTHMCVHAWDISHYRGASRAENWISFIHFAALVATLHLHLSSSGTCGDTNSEITVL